MLHAKYLSPRPCGFVGEDFCSFYYIHIWKTNEPPGRGQYWPQGHNLNNLGRALSDDVACQIYKPSALRFRRRRFLKFFLSVAMATRVLHGMEFFEQFWKAFMQGTFLLTFNWIWASGLGGEVVWMKKLTDGRTHARRTTDDEQLGVTKAHLEHFVLRWANKWPYNIYLFLPNLR